MISLTRLSSSFFYKKFLQEMGKTTAFHTAIIFWSSDYQKVIISRFLYINLNRFRTILVKMFVFHTFYSIRIHCKLLQKHSIQSLQYLRLNLPRLISWLSNYEHCISAISMTINCVQIYGFMSTSGIHIWFCATPVYLFYLLLRVPI